MEVVMKTVSGNGYFHSIIFYCFTFLCIVIVWKWKNHGYSIDKWRTPVTNPHDEATPVTNSGTKRKISGEEPTTLYGFTTCSVHDSEHEEDRTSNNKYQPDLYTIPGMCLVQTSNIKLQTYLYMIPGMCVVQTSKSYTSLDSLGKPDDGLETAVEVD